MAKIRRAPVADPATGLSFVADGVAGERRRFWHVVESGDYGLAASRLNFGRPSPKQPCAAFARAIRVVDASPSGPSRGTARFVKLPT
jgi:hypothetical protein